ncbi:AAA family ATPase [Nocardia sp. bgisy118]|uniref:AAA family ATPase n=1 Tax=Nocardia sp. bgisy118 TaxID=3413786 RepID=UPI003F49CCB4
MTYEFDTTTYTEALKLADEGETWVVENIIGAGTTLIYGEAKVGKSFLVSALIKSLAIGTEFLNKPVPQDRAFSVAVCWTDDMGAQEYSTRIRTVMPADEAPDVRFYHLPIMRTPDMWQALYERVMSDGHNFVVIDNLAQTLNGSINDDAEVRKFFDGVRLFVRAGIPVVIVAHSSDKAGVNGFKPETPMGSAYITQAVRWRVFVRRSKRGNVTLKLMGNHAEPYEMTLYHGAGARFEVIDVKTAEALKASAEGAARARGKATLDHNAEVADWIVANCQGLSVMDVARKLEPEFGGKVNSYKRWLNQEGKLGMLLERDGTTWKRRG